MSYSDEDDGAVLVQLRDEYLWKFRGLDAKAANADDKAQGASINPKQFLERLKGRLDARAQVSTWLLPELARLGQAISLVGAHGPEVMSQSEAATRLMALAMAARTRVAEQQFEETNETAVVDGPSEGGPLPAPTDAVQPAGEISTRPDGGSVARHPENPGTDKPSSGFGVVPPDEPA